MNLARGLERRLENLVDGAGATVFRGRMHPVMIGSKILRQLDFLAFETLAGTQIPNDLVVSMNPADIDPGSEQKELVAELERVVTDSAREQGWRLVGEASIQINTDPTVPRGVLGCTGTSVVSHIAPWCQFIADDGSAVLAIAMNRSVIGRGLDCDIRIANEQISRHHALVVAEGSVGKIADMGSSNGTALNGTRVGTTPVPIAPGDNILLGDLSFTYRRVA